MPDIFSAPGQKVSQKEWDRIFGEKIQVFKTCKRKIHFADVLREKKPVKVNFYIRERG